jgi:periplasmic divalent cation tolerance protein
MEVCMKDRTFLVFSTTDSETEAARIGRHVVEKGLAACVGIIPRIRSIYSWEGKIHDEKECLLLMKTSERALDELEKTVKEIHSYDLPEFFALDMDRCEKGYKAWLLDMTGVPQGGGEGSEPGVAPRSDSSST